MSEQGWFARTAYSASDKARIEGLVKKTGELMSDVSFKLGISTLGHVVDIRERVIVSKFRDSFNMPLTKVLHVRMKVGALFKHFYTG